MSPPPSAIGTVCTSGMPDMVVSAAELRRGVARRRGLAGRRAAVVSDDVLAFGRRVAVRRVLEVRFDVARRGDDFAVEAFRRVELAARRVDEAARRVVDVARRVEPLAT